jgi:hypothetical protein
MNITYEVCTGMNSLYVMKFVPNMRVNIQLKRKELNIFIYCLLNMSSAKFFIFEYFSLSLLLIS